MTSHVTKVYLLLKIKYIEFEYRPKMLIKKPGLSKFSYDETDKKSFLPRIGKDEHWTTFCESCEVTNSIETL